MLKTGFRNLRRLGTLLALLTLAQSVLASSQKVGGIWFLGPQAALTLPDNNESTYTQVGLQASVYLGKSVGLVGTALYSAPQFGETYTLEIGTNWHFLSEHRNLYLLGRIGSSWAASEVALLATLGGGYDLFLTPRFYLAPEVSYTLPVTTSRTTFSTLQLAVKWMLE